MPNNHHALTAYDLLLLSRPYTAFGDVRRPAAEPGWPGSCQKWHTLSSDHGNPFEPEGSARYRGKCICCGQSTWVAAQVTLNTTGDTLGYSHKSRQDR